MKSILTRSFFVLLFSTSCQQSPYNKEAINLNNTAITISATDPDSALRLFDRAILQDSTYHLALQNKTNLLIKLKRYTEAITSTDQFISKLSVPQTWIMKGILLEKNNQQAEATLAYTEGLRLQEELMAKAPEAHKGTHYINMAFTYFLMGDTVKTKKLITQYAKDAEKIPLADSILHHLDDKEKIVNLFLDLH